MGFPNGPAEGGQTQIPRVLIIGAGSRGNAYSRAIATFEIGKVYAVAEPVEFKRELLGKKYIWREGKPLPGQEFKNWKAFIGYELQRRKRLLSGEHVEEGVDAVFVCTLDTQHAEIIKALAPLKLHVMSEKPLATTLQDCLDIYSSLMDAGERDNPGVLFSIGHVLRYSPHNILLRDLLLHRRRIGDIISIEHTEPVGWYHFSHSYVRGNWRKESTTAPSLLTKSCHDIDLILWLLCSPPESTSSVKPHLPSTISSSGRLNYFRKVRKPKEALESTNCLSCGFEPSCIYSAKKIYNERFLSKGHTGWPVKIVNPEIETCYVQHGPMAAEEKLLATLAEDYDNNEVSVEQRDSRPWFGRCVWESDNDVCDDQIVSITWDDDHEPSSPGDGQQENRFAKSATFHMVAQTEAQCKRRGRVYGTHGEIAYDSTSIRVCDFSTGDLQTYHPGESDTVHGGGDEGLARQFLLAVDAVKNQGTSVDTAQQLFIGCTLDEIVRSHAVVFAAEESRREAKVVQWPAWWKAEVLTKLNSAHCSDVEHEIV